MPDCKKKPKEGKSDKSQAKPESRMDALLRAIDKVIADKKD